MWGQNIHYLICCCLSYRAAIEKLHSADDAFCQQLESVRAAHQAELIHLASDKQREIEQANQKVKIRPILQFLHDQKQTMELKDFLESRLFIVVCNGNKFLLLILYCII